MSEFNKEQLQIFIHNFFIVIGLVGGFGMLHDGQEYLNNGNIQTAYICFSFSLSTLGISMWMLVTAIWKGLKLFIETYIAMISQMEEDLELKIKVIKDIILERKEKNNKNED